MIDLNDVLLAMSNIPVDDPIAEIWGRGLQGGYKIIEYTGTLPITINANGDALLDYRIYGADGGVGEPTDSGEPTGYKLPMKSGAPTIYGFHINPDESGSYNCVTYLNDAVGMTPAAMGSTAFNYGSWENAFFMPKPCMLKFDGTVDYYLDPNDYSKKADGVTPSDYNNLAYQGNAMMEFPLIWYKFVPGVAEGEGYFYCSNHKVDNTYKCWSNMDCDGNIIEHFYMPIYNGCTYDGKMRSISGLTLASWSTTVYSANATYAVGDKINYDGKMWQCTTAVETAEAFDPAKWEQFAFNGNTIATEEIAQATANNTTAKTEWYIDTWNNRVLINGLLVLISKSIDTQGTFGRGIDSGRQEAKESYVTGSLDDKGLFYGSTTNGVTAVKVFGMENWWGLAWHRTAGLIGGDNNVYLYKMTFSTADGSIVDGYNTSGTGYPSVGGRPTTSNYIKKMQFGLFGFLPIEVGSYSTQYYKDYYYNGTGFALVGGHSNYGGAGDGAFCVYLSIGAGDHGWGIGTAPSCKPLREKFSDKSGNAASLATTTPVYIGENQLDSVNGVADYIDKANGKIVRMIGEYTFTGDESFNKYGSSDVFYTSKTIDPVGITTVNTITMRCNHPAFTAIENKDTRYWLNPEADDICCFLPGGRSQVFLRSTSNFTTATECKAYLKAQYDNGTPVKISYWLKTPIEEAPPVPLPEIPTIDGETIIDYDGTPKPSQVYVKYKGKE